MATPNIVTAKKEDVVKIYNTYFHRQPTESEISWHVGKTGLEHLKTWAEEKSGKSLFSYGNENNLKNKTGIFADKAVRQAARRAMISDIESTTRKVVAPSAIVKATIKEIPTTIKRGGTIDLAISKVARNLINKIPGRTIIIKGPRAVRAIKDVNLKL